MVGVRNATMVAMLVLVLPVSAGVTPDSQVRGVGVVGAADFGSAMARDGEWLAVAAESNFVGSAETGSVFVFRNVAGQWVQVQRLDPDATDDAKRFGSDVALKDGLLVVGSSWDTDGGMGAGAAYVYRLGLATFELEQKLHSPTPASGNYFGESVATDGTRIFVTSWDKPAFNGAIHIFTKGTSWSQVQKLTPNGAEWYEGELEVDGGTLVLGSLYDDSFKQRAGAVYVFTLRTSWTRTQKITPSDLGQFDNFGSGVAVQGAILVAGAPGQDGAGKSNRGAVYIYRNTAAGWTLDKKFVGGTAGERLGFHTATDGVDVLASAPWRGLGEVDHFRKSGTWVQTGSYEGDGLSQDVGTSLLLDGHILAGAPRDPLGGVVHRYG